MVRCASRKAGGGGAGAGAASTRGGGFGAKTAPKKPCKSAFHPSSNGTNGMQPDESNGSNSSDFFYVCLID